ncbi:hypothetical protein GCM10023314_30250 [Algibacter agarivorans]|uniref:Cellobiose phosphorylase n=1 Tax=Algibacter agarivorans TaxID=1109741 RepID=A0ABP9GVD3_9FLAO
MTLNTKLNIKNTQGLTFNFLKNGLVQNIESKPIRISLKNATAFSKSGANIYLRKKTTNGYDYKPLLGSESNSHFSIVNNMFIAKGNWDGIDYTCTLQLSEKSLSWQWDITIKNTTKSTIILDVIYVQDVGLKKITDKLVNEYYVSQYVERQILEDEKYGSIICCRQNFMDTIGNPWLMIACKNSAMSASTDGIQLYGNSYRKTGTPESLLKESLAGECSGELSILTLQEKPFGLEPNAPHKSTFVAACIADHPKATSQKDLELLPIIIKEFDTEVHIPDTEKTFITENNLFNTAPLFPVDDLTNKDLYHFFGNNLRNVEEKNGQVLSFFYKENNHVVLRTKESLVDRPHGHIMQAKMGITPDEDMMSTSTYMYGVFNSHITQGNTNYNRFLSICSSQFNLEPQTGQRIFVEVEGQKYLLGVPSAYEIGLNHCRWIYKQGDTCFQVRSWTSKSTPEVYMDFKVLNGAPVKLLITNHCAEDNGWHIPDDSSAGTYIFSPSKESVIAKKFPEAQFKIHIHNSDYKVYGDEILYPDHKSQGDPFFNIELENTSNFCMSFIGEVTTTVETTKIENSEKQYQSDLKDGQAYWENLSSNLSLKSDNKDIAVIQEILPWYGVNAMTHVLTPHGLEQFDGAAWGTRDTTQGPFELLLCMHKFEEAKEVMRIMFSKQDPDGGWPQWFMFDSYADVRHDHAHGDIHHWCIIALGNYIKATGDVDFLNEVLPYYHENGRKAAEKTPLLEHVERLIDMLVASFIPNTAFVPFGGGDWNDSMQPASKTLAERLISSWTVALNYQAFSIFQSVYELIGDTEKKARLQNICTQIKTDFNKHLIKDNIVAGHGLLEADNSISLLLHPTDTKTNIQYRLLPMIRGIISGIFTKEQAEFHQNLIEQHLKAPDGARLMNRPPKYSGGIQTVFQRAESSSYFGREVGIMYMHAHLRYAETQARTGNAGAFVKALRQANPIAYNEVVACGDVRQANCYYSSSDVTFKNRYEADKRYEELKAGKITLKGGWRIYSSGPGIYMGLIVWHLLGLRTEFGKTIIDPVIPKSLDGLSASIEYKGFLLTLNFLVKEDEYHPKAIRINGKDITFSYEDNQYRKGGAVLDTEKFLGLLNTKENRIEIQL